MLMNQLNIPKRILDKDLSKLKEKVLKVLKDELENSIGFDEMSEYNIMTYSGLTSHQEFQIKESIGKALNILTENSEQEWIDKFSDKIINILDGFIDSLMEVEVSNLLFSNINSYVLGDIIYYNIKWHLEKTLFI